MKKNRIAAIIVLCLTFSLHLSFWTPVLAVAETETGFAGTRFVEFSADKSDIDNFIDGGKSSFDLILRANTPEWIVYQMSSEGRDTHLTLQFDFTSYDDYIAKISELLTYSPAVVYSTENGLLLIESHSALGFMNYLQEILLSRDCLSEKELDEIFVVKTNRIMINETEYESDDRLYIRPDDDSVIPFDSLNISTTNNEDGSFTRRIIVGLNTHDIEIEDTISSRFEFVGETDSTRINADKSEISVEFTSSDQAELIEKTMTCLGAATSIVEKQKFLDSKNVSVERVEFFDLNSLLNKEGEFYYSHTYPSYIENLSANSDDVNISDGTVTAKNTSEVICLYERPFKFSSVCVYTDLSNLFGKLKRTITFTVPAEIASDYHDRIKSEFQQRLVKGSVFNIYDNNGRRYYEIIFSSFFTDDLAEFTNAILNAEGNIAYKNSWIPFGRSSMQEEIRCDKIIGGTIPPDRITLSYNLPVLSTVSTESDDMHKTDSTVEYYVMSSDSIRLEYKCLNIMKTLIELLPLVVVLIVILIVRKKLKNKKKKSTPGFKKFCRKCGAQFDSDVKICGVCGTPFVSVSENKSKDSIRIKEKLKPKVTKTK